MTLGGQGAPLAPFFHFACAKWIKASQPIAFLNLGGVGNITWIDPDFDKPEEKRLLYRLWLAPPDSVRLPQSWWDFYRSTEPGTVRGGIRGHEHNAELHEFSDNFHVIN